ARSLKFYRFIKLLLQYLETPILAIHAQSSIDAERFAAVFNKPVFNSSNLKYALYLEEYDSSSMRKEWGFGIDDFIICWGSSRPGEEALLISILPELSLSIPNLKIIIAPRHLERLPELQNLLIETNYKKYSDRIESISANILLIDEMGVLPKAYAICDIAIVGGSFRDFGGHNPLEPAFYSRPIVIGEFHNSCKESVTKLQENAGIMISDAKSLLHDLQKLASNPALRTKMGKNSCQVLRNNSSALNIQLEAIIQAASEN
ncbi:MAG: 3-deoxy-D-manno-octulosonic acid transferase, partial [Candidatus Cloacimonetes bacterium]|nr:3-deoxy-D-manno-octulosonic acid transferase [Candidatus Cloacimonadota bacterium]